MVEYLISVKLEGDAAALIDEIVLRGYAISKDEVLRNALIDYGFKLGFMRKIKKNKEKPEIASLKTTGASDNQILEKLITPRHHLNNEEIKIVVDMLDSVKTRDSVAIDDLVVEYGKKGIEPTYVLRLIKILIMVGELYCPKPGFIRYTRPVIERKFDSDIISIGQPKSRVDRMRTVLGIIEAMEKKVDAVAIEDVLKECATYGLEDSYARKLIDDLNRQGDFYPPKPGYIRSARKSFG